MVFSNQLSVATPSVCILLKLTFPASFVCKKTAKVILLMIPFVPCFAGRTSAYFCLCSKLDIDHTYKETPSILQDPKNSLYIGRKIRHLLIRNGKSPVQLARKANNRITSTAPLQVSCILIPDLRQMASLFCVCNLFFFFPSFIAMLQKKMNVHPSKLQDHDLRSISYVVSTCTHLCRHKE